jgi:PAS domain S-box-containing protein
MGNVDDRGDSRQDALGDVGPPARVLRTIIDLTDDAVLTCSADGTVTYVSDNAERLFGRRPQDLRHELIENLFPLHLNEEVRGVFSRVLAGERIRHFETEIVRPDGLPVPVSLSLAPATGPNGSVRGGVVVARDVTEQHLAQAMLAEVDARLEESEALSHIGSWLWDVRTGAVQWSAEFHRIHGVDPLDFAGTFGFYMDCLDPDDRERVCTAMSESVQGSRPLDLEYRVVHPDRKTHVIWVHANPTVGSDGRAVGLRGIGQDVTDQAEQPWGSVPPD